MSFTLQENNVLIITLKTTAFNCDSTKGLDIIMAGKPAWLPGTLMK